MINENHGVRRTRMMELLKTLNWIVCGIAASVVAFLGFDHLQRVLLSVFSIPGYYFWTAYILAITSPVCVAVAWLRLTGMTWRRALGLFLFVPAGVFVIWFVTDILPYMFAN